jgi:nicotinamidase-related amidase
MHQRATLERYELVLIDLNTQKDFLHPGGAYPIRDRAEVLRIIQNLSEWIRRHRVPLISALDAHRFCEVPPKGEPIHCIDGSNGQRKIDCTIMPDHYWVEYDNTLGVSLDLLLRHQQVVFRQRRDDLLSNPKADRFLTQLAAKEFVVFGNGTENAVKAVVLGLLARRKHVSIITDACGYWDGPRADLAMRQMLAKGACPLTSEALMSRSLRPSPLDLMARRRLAARRTASQRKRRAERAASAHRTHERQVLSDSAARPKIPAPATPRLNAPPE